MGSGSVGGKLGVDKEILKCAICQRQGFDMDADYIGLATVGPSYGEKAIPICEDCYDLYGISHTEIGSSIEKPTVKYRASDGRVVTFRSLGSDSIDRHYAITELGDYHLTKE